MNFYTSFRRNNFNLSFVVLSLIFLLVGCSRKPVLYQNSQLERAGEEIAQQDIDECMEQARKAGAKGESQAKKSAKDAGIGAAAGSAASAVGSAIYNGSVSGRGIAAGAGAGAAGSLVYGLFRKDADPVFERYVNLCLREKGYDPIGWQ